MQLCKRVSSLYRLHCRCFTSINWNSPWLGSKCGCVWDKYDIRSALWIEPLLAIEHIGVGVRLKPLQFSVSWWKTTFLSPTLINSSFSTALHTVLSDLSTFQRPHTSTCQVVVQVGVNRRRLYKRQPFYKKRQPRWTFRGILKLEWNTARREWCLLAKYFNGISLNVLSEFNLVKMFSICCFRVS